MSVEEEIDNIKQQKLASDMPDEFDAIPIKMYRDVKKGEFAGTPLLKTELLLDDGETFTTSYRIPKAWTGKGQMDLLKECLENMKITLKTYLNNRYHYKRLELKGSMTGQDRHYPVKLLKKNAHKPS